MTPCTYVRRRGEAFEFGIVRLVEGGTKNEKREHVPYGTRPTMDEALIANKMALGPCPLKGRCHQHYPFWRY